MDETKAQQGRRSLAQIESDLLTAETAFADADKRLKQAERDRSAALDTINKHQMEFDDAVTKLRQRGTAGSKWQLELGGPKDALILQPEDIAEDANQAGRPRLASVAVEFDRLKAVAQPARGSGEPNGRHPAGN